MKAVFSFILSGLALTAAANPIPGHPHGPGGELPNGSVPQPGPQSTAGTILPTISTYDVGDGAINCHPQAGKVYKSDSDGGHDLTSLLTFVYPPQVQGKQCWFGFELNPGDVATGDDGPLLDIFTTNSPAPGCTYSWPPGNERNINLGRMQAVLPGPASWVATYDTYLTQPSPCEAPGTVVSMELVGVSDNNDIEWNLNLSGPRIFYQ